MFPLVDNADPVRIDLKIPPENFMYLKAATAAERQKWLVALGTAKACLVDSNYEEQQQQCMFSNQYFDNINDFYVREYQSINTEVTHPCTIIQCHAKQH